MGRGFSATSSMSGRHGKPRWLFFARGARNHRRVSMKPPPVIVGVDTGGTFTDLVAFVGGTLRVHKVLSTPDDPAAAVLRGLRAMLPHTAPGVVTYGTTVATNALLERRG